MLLTDGTEAFTEYQLEEMDYQVVHTITGRFRIRVPRLARDLEYASKLNWLIESLNFVTSVRINPAASSVIVNYEVNVVSSAVAQKELFTCIQQANIAESLLEATVVETEPEYLPQVNNWQDLGLPLISLGLALVAAPFELPPLIIGAAIAGAAMPWFNRATDSIVTHGHPNMDLLDSVWMTLQTIQGQYVAPALKTSLVEIRRSFRGTEVQTNAQQALDLLDCLNQYAWVERNGQEQLIPSKDLLSGDRVIVHPGELVPVDGRILQGVALIDTRNLTDEATPFVCSEGQDIYASTLVLEGKLCVLVKRTGHNTRAGLVAHLLRSAPVHDTQIAAYQAEFVKNAIVPTLCLGSTIFALTGNMGAVIAPFQLDFGSGIQIAMPTVILAALTYAARNGVYIRSGRVLETLSRINTVVFDKTDTLIQGDVATNSVRPESRGVIATLLDQGIDVYMLTDEDQRVTNAVANNLGNNPSNIYAEAFAEKKVDLRELHNDGRTVAFVGDSINNTATLAHTDVSVSFAGGSDIARETADVVLLDNDLRGLIYAIDVAQRAMEIVYQNTATIVIPNLIVQIGGGIFFGLSPVVNVITNNVSAFIAEFLNSSPPLFGTGALTKSALIPGKEPQENC